MRASLFITCIVDQLYPQVGEAVVHLLTDLGVEVTFNADQTCFRPFTSACSTRRASFRL